MCKISVLKLILLRAASCLPHLHKTSTPPSTKYQGDFNPKNTNLVQQHEKSKRQRTIHMNTKGRQ
jgi:hypothetical protein